MREQSRMTESAEAYNYKYFFELSADLFCIAGFDGYFKHINLAVSDLLGYTKEELFSRPINEFVHPDDQEVTERVRQEIRNNKPLLNFENRYVTRTGEVVWLSWTSMPVYSDRLVFAIAKNITYKVKLEEERNRLLTNLTKINKEYRQFSYTVSHDLRSPLSSLITVIDMFDDSIINDEPTLKLIEVLKKGSLQIKNTVDNHLEVLIRKNEVDISLEELDLEETLNRVLQSVDSLVSNSRASFQADFSGERIIRFNKAYLESIFLNLITNSIKYARPDSLPVISIYSAKVSGRSQLIFTDNGQGFDMEKVKGRVFGLHQKFHNQSDSKGIGLYLVYNHVTSLGGHIKLESQVGKGAKFIITFL